MKFLEKHGIKVQVATVTTVLIFVVGTVIIATQDRDRAFSEINSSKKELAHVRQDLAVLRKTVCDLEDDIDSEISELKSKTHSIDIAFTEIKTKLVNVEAMLLKIDKKIN